MMKRNKDLEMKALSLMLKVEKKQIKDKLS